MRRLATCVLSLLIAVPLVAAAPLHKVPGAVAGRYIVLLDEEHPSAAHAESLTRSAGATLVHTYDTVLNGFSIRATEQKATALTRMPGVASVWEVPAARANDVQANPPKGLDRIDQRELPLNNSYTYYANTLTTTIYIVDTGLDPRPSELGTRVVANVNFWTGAAGQRDPNDYTDGGLPLEDSWHGTPHATRVAGGGHRNVRGRAARRRGLRRSLDQHVRDLGRDRGSHQGSGHAGSVVERLGEFEQPAALLVVAAAAGVITAGARPGRLSVMPIIPDLRSRGGVPVKVAFSVIAGTCRACPAAGGRPGNAPPRTPSRLS